MSMPVPAPRHPQASLWAPRGRFAHRTMTVGRDSPAAPSSAPARRPTTRAGRQTTLPTARSLPCEPIAVGTVSSLDRDFSTHGHQTGQLGRIPVRQADAAMRLRAADRGWLRRAVQAEMRFVDVDPDYADRIIRSGRDLRFRVRRIRIPEQIRVVVERRVPRYAGHFPVADRKRIFRAANGDGRMHENFSTGVAHDE